VSGKRNVCGKKGRNGETKKRWLNVIESVIDEG